MDSVVLGLDEFVQLLDIERHFSSTLLIFVINLLSTVFSPLKNQIKTTEGRIPRVRHTHEIENMLSTR